MKYLSHLFFFLCILILPMSIFAVSEFYSFKKNDEQIRFQTLTSELRCLVCQNQNLAESNSGLANDLRHQIYEKIQQGDSDQAIIAYLVARYGNYILYKPPLNTLTIGLWFGPILLLMMGLGYLLYYLKIKSRR